MASSSSSASKSKKRKHVVLTLESKIAILDRLKAGATQAKLSEEYGIVHVYACMLEYFRDSRIRLFHLSGQGSVP